jgi:hypothetical protein
LRYLMSAVCALAVLASFAGTANAATVVYCGVVAPNSITSGQGSGPRTFEFREPSSPPGGGRFGVPNSVEPLPTIGSYICGQFEQGAPLVSLVAYVRPGDPGYVSQPGAVTSSPLATSAPIATSAPLPSAVPATPPPPQTGFTLGFNELLLGLALFAAVALLVMRNRRAPTAG